MATTVRRDDFWEDSSAKGPGFLKAGFIGFQGSGKTLTATLLAIIVREMFGLEGPLSYFDTEGGAAYLREHVVTPLTGRAPLIKPARSFEDLMTWGRKCLEHGVSVGIVDSITHPWRELCDGYLAQINQFRKSKGWRPQRSLEFQDWNIVKQKWTQWTEFYLNSPFHLIVCGRAGYEYDMEENEEKEKKELVKTGIKMKTEGEFGYEPSLLVQMVLDRTVKRNRQQQIRRAVVFKDRFMLLDGRECDFPSTNDAKKALGPVRTFFLPHLNLLKPGGHSTVDTTQRTDFEVDDNGDDGYRREKQQREILSEEIQGVLTVAYPGQTQADKQTKAKLLYNAFGTFSWEQVKRFHSDILRSGLRTIREEIEAAGIELPAGPAQPPQRPNGTPGVANEPGAAEAAEAFTDGVAGPTPEPPPPTPELKARKKAAAKGTQASLVDAEQVIQ